MVRFHFNRSNKFRYGFVKYAIIPRISGLSLFQLLTILRKNEFLKHSVLKEKVLNVFGY